MVPQPVEFVVHEMQRLEAALGMLRSARFDVLSNVPQSMIDRGPQKADVLLCTFEGGKGREVVEV
jgi:hypothetical protein